MREWVRSPGGVVVLAVEGHLGESGSVGARKARHREDRPEN